MTRPPLRLILGGNPPDEPKPRIPLTAIADQFDPRRLTQAMALAMMDEQEMSNQTTLTVLGVKQIIHGATKPQPHHIQQFADLFKYPPQFFMWGRPIPSIGSNHVHVCGKSK